MSTRDFERPASRVSWRRRAVLGVVLGLLAVVIWRCSAVLMRRAAVQALEDSGWTVIFDEPAADTSTLLDTLVQHLGPRGSFLAGMLGQEPEVVEVRIADMEATSDGETALTVLKRLPHLERLSVQRETLSVSDVATIGRIATLTELSIASDSLTDASLAELAELSRLRSLTIISQRVTDAGLSHLEGIRTLRSLDLQSTRAGGGGVDAFPGLESLALGPATVDVDLESVAELPQLKTLILSDSRISDVGLRRLQPLQTLETFHLSGPHTVTDDGLQVVESFVRLQHLTLYGQQYSFTGLAPLADLSQLQQLELRGGGLNDAGFDTFQPPASLLVLRLHYTSISNESFDRFETRYPKVKLWR